MSLKKTSIATPDQETNSSESTSSGDTRKRNTRFEGDDSLDVNSIGRRKSLRTPGAVSVEYTQGILYIAVPLPGRKEQCRFALRPASQKVGDLINMLKEEDEGIRRVIVLNQDGVRIATACSIDSLMEESFWLKINDKKYKVYPPEREGSESLGGTDLGRLSEIRTLVGHLYDVLNVGGYHIAKEEELTNTLQSLKGELAPLESRKSQINIEAQRKSGIMMWVGLGLMSVQFVILVRLTFWDLSWETMEPITYFFTYGTAILVYAYYCFMRSEYNIPDLKDREFLLSVYKHAKRKNFDISNYNHLKRQIAELEHDLRRFHDPVNLKLPRRSTLDPTRRTLATLETRESTAFTSDAATASEHELSDLET